MSFLGRAWNLGRGFVRVLSQPGEDREVDDVVGRELARSRRAPANADLDRLSRELKAAGGADPLPVGSGSRADRLERLDRAFTEGQLGREEYLRRRAALGEDSDDAPVAPDGTPEVRRTL